MFQGGVEEVGGEVEVGKSGVWDEVVAGAIMSVGDGAASGWEAFEELKGVDECRCKNVYSVGV